MTSRTATLARRWATIAWLVASATPPASVARAAVPARIRPTRAAKSAARKRSRPDAPSVEPEGCRKLPPGRRLVRLNLKPDTDLNDLVAWISSITCKDFIVSGSIDAASKKVSIFAPETITPEEAYRLFLDALDSDGLTVQGTGKFLQIIETAKAKSSPIPLYVPEKTEADPPGD
jgi:hypothetical protein